MPELTRSVASPDASSSYHISVQDLRRRGLLGLVEHSATVGAVEKATPPSAHGVGPPQETKNTQVASPRDSIQELGQSLVARLVAVLARRANDVRERAETYALLSSSVGGRETTLIPPKSRMSTPHVNRGGGLRGPVIGASRNSLRRKRRFLASIDSRKRKYSRLFLTLTLPTDFEVGETEEAMQTAWAEAQRHLLKWKTKVVKRFGPFGCMWTKEPQRRGVPHYHLLLYLPDGVSIKEFKRFARKSWLTVVAGDEPSASFRRRAFEGGVVKSWEAVVRYMAKAPKFKGSRGRTWSVWNHSLIPRSPDKQWPPVREYLAARRILRRLTRPSRGRWRLRPFRSRETAIHAFIGHGEMLRLIEFLGMRTT